MPLCLRVPKVSGQRVLRALGEMGLLSRSFKVTAQEESLLLPLERRPSDLEMERLAVSEPAAVLTEAFLPRAVARPTLLNVLSERLPPHLLASVPRSIDHVGDIAVIELAPKLWEHRTTIGDAILAVERHTRTVLAKRGPVAGAFRLRGYEVVAGEKRTTTVHRENGCIFHLDLAKVYFTPRLSFEHQRVAASVKESETVADLFSGVGPYAVQIARRLQDVRVYAVDLNPAAVEYLKLNIAANKVWGKVIPTLGDAREAVRTQLARRADRVIMNLPTEATAFLDAACLALKPEGGVVHHYAFLRAGESIESVQATAAEAIHRAGREVERVLAARTLRAVAPRTYLVALDLSVK
ncbi:MAG: class I SAM-dependent methyltransferase family protein [Candidatus Bathyarchaeia archaeon]